MQLAADVPQGAVQAPDLVGEGGAGRAAWKEEAGGEGPGPGPCGAEGRASVPGRADSQSAEAGQGLRTRTRKACGLWAGKPERLLLAKRTRSDRLPEAAQSGGGAAVSLSTETGPSQPPALSSLRPPLTMRQGPGL